MEAHAVYIHRWQPRSVLEGPLGEFYAVQTPSRWDIRLQDRLSGELAMESVSRLLNLNRQVVVCVDVLGCYATKASAIDATMAPYFTPASKDARGDSPGRANGPPLFA